MHVAVLRWGIVGGLAFVLTGCMAVRTSNRVPRAQDEMIHGLQDEVQQLNQELLTVQQQRDLEMMKMKQMEQDLLSRLQQEIGDREANVSMDDRGVVIQFLSQVFFASGRAELTAKGKESLAKIVDILKASDRNIRIEGHTDNQPINRTKNIYESNWELSAARALTVLDFFQAEGLSEKLFSLAGYGEHRPVVSNDSREGRQKNRRVEIVVIPHEIVDPAEEQAAKEASSPRVVAPLK